MPTAAVDLLGLDGLDVHRLVQRLAPQADDVAYMTGSLFDGVGDTASDVDVYLLTSAEDLERRRASGTAERRLQQHRRNFVIQSFTDFEPELDVEVHCKEKLVLMSQALHSLDPSDLVTIRESFDSLASFERSEAIEFLHRFLIGRPIWNPEEFQRLRDQLPSDRYFAWNAQIFLTHAADCGKGVRRFLERNDAQNAYLLLRSGYDALADAYLFATGHSLDRWKWRLPKLRKFAPSAFVERYLDVQLSRNGRGERLEDFVRERLAVAEHDAADIRESLHHASSR